MENFIEYLNRTNIDFDSLWKSLVVLLLGTLLSSIFGRLVFGKRSTLNVAVSSAIGTVFIYITTVILGSLGALFEKFTAPLPFVDIDGTSMTLFSFNGAHYTAICTEILNMVILSFLINIADRWLPDGNNFFAWILFRCLTVTIGYLLYLAAIWLFAAILPATLATYAPTILLCLLILLLLTGALKIVVGGILSSINPIIGCLYTFFFATVIGKQITRAMLTTALLTALILALQYVGLTVISFTEAALTAYIPVLMLLIALWYLAMKVF